jgi:hypothetical protein
MSTPKKATAESTGTGHRIRRSDNSSLPLASVLEQSQMDAAVALLKQSYKLKQQEDKIKEQLEEIKLELSGLCAGLELNGLRWGKSGFEYRGYVTRKTLSKELLLENGVEPETIAASYKESEPYLDTRFVVFDE